MFGTPEAVSGRGWITCRIRLLRIVTMPHQKPERRFAVHQTCLLMEKTYPAAECNHMLCGQRQAHDGVNAAAPAAAVKNGQGRYTVMPGSGCERVCFYYSTGRRAMQGMRRGSLPDRMRSRRYLSKQECSGNMHHCFLMNRIKNVVFL